MDIKFMQRTAVLYAFVTELLNRGRTYCLFTVYNPVLCLSDSQRFDNRFCQFRAFDDSVVQDFFFIEIFQARRYGHARLFAESSDVCKTVRFFRHAQSVRYAGSEFVCAGSRGDDSRCIVSRSFFVIFIDFIRNGGMCVDEITVFSYISAMACSVSSSSAKPP